jgi:hypothetical protein
MNARLIADLARRQRRSATFMTLSIAVLWCIWWALVGTDDLRQTFGYSMGMAFMLGPQLSMRYAPRPLWYLPLSRRDTWRALWWASTVGATALAAGAKLIALVACGRLASDLGTLALSSVYDFAYCGMGCAIAAGATRPRPPDTPWRQISAMLAGFADVAMPFGGVAAFAGLPMLPVRLPTHWSEFTAVSGAVLVAALVVTATGYFHVPVPARVAPSGAPARTATDRRRSVTGGLSGLSRLLVHEYVFTLGVGTVLAVGSTAVLLIASHVRAFDELVAFLQLEIGRLDGRNLPPEGGADPFIVLVLVASFAATLASRYPAMMRHLRVLPLGSGPLQALLAAWPAVIWLQVWIASLAAHYLLLGTMVQSLHLAAFVGLAGLSALVVASSLYLNGPQHSVVFFALMVAVPMLLFVGFPPPTASLAFGVAALVAAIAMNRAALLRSATYRHSGLPFAIPFVR